MNRPLVLAFVEQEAASATFGDDAHATRTAGTLVAFKILEETLEPNSEDAGKLEQCRSADPF